MSQFCAATVMDVLKSIKSECKKNAPDEKKKLLIQGLPQDLQANLPLSKSLPASHLSYMLYFIQRFHVQVQ